MINEGSQKLAKIGVAPLCKEDALKRLKRSHTLPSSLPSLARLGVFNVTDTRKSRSIRKPTNTGTSVVWEPEKGPAKSLDKLTVLATESGLEEYRRWKSEEQSVRVGESSSNNRHGPTFKRRAPLLGEDRYRRPLKLQQGGTVRTDVTGVERAHFPLRCKAAGRRETGSRSLCRRLGKWEEGVVTRLCDSKLFTGTASSGQPPTMVDLEAGAGVLLRDLPKAIKGGIGAQEVSWRLRLAERL